MGEPPVRPPTDDLRMGQEPKQEAFDDYQKYLDAKISFEVNKAKITWDRDQSRKAQEQTHQQKLTILHEKLEEGFRKYPDFEEIAMDRTVPITPVIMDILAESERPHDLAYYLGRNRAEAIRISRLTPIQATREIAKIEAKLDEAGGDLPPPSKPIIPGAPPPIRPVGSSHTVERSFEKMSQKEFETEMQKRLGRRY